MFVKFMIVEKSIKISRLGFVLFMIVKEKVVKNVEVIIKF